MLQDRYGLELTTSSEDARDAYVDGIDRMLSANGGVEASLQRAIASDPDFALAHVALARQHQLMARGAEARTVMETAAGLTEGLTPRERQHVEIHGHLLSGQIPRSLELTREHLREHPRDAFALAPACGVFGSIGFSGRIDREPEQLELLEPLAADYGNDWWFLTVHAFALLETGRWEEGRALAERSLDRYWDNPHAAHTLAHAMFEAGEDREATEFMADWVAKAENRGVLHCHNWWHYAILLMAAGDDHAAWQAFADHCLPGTTDSPSINVLTDASSYLWRAELAGRPRHHDTWETIRQFYEANFRRPIVFVDAHVGLAYAALGMTEELNACIEQLQQLGQAGKLPADTTAATLTRAYQAFAGERWSTVIDLLEPVMPEVVRIGGSRAQRDLVTNTLLAAYVKADRRADAQALLAGVVDRQPSRPVAGLAA